MDAPVVRTRAGAVQGTRVAGGFAYLGIPYAEPAVGADRFAAPRPRAPWDGTRDATAHGPTSLQADYPAPMDRLLAGAVDPGDDYLNVAVWTPDPGATGLPVIVWIHGGAFVRGANRIPTYDGAAFARDGVVLVGINYRLGVPGFGVVDGAPANLGLRDQLCALQWVRDEIAAFGGALATLAFILLGIKLIITFHRGGGIREALSGAGVIFLGLMLIGAAGILVGAIQQIVKGIGG